MASCNLCYSLMVIWTQGRCIMLKSYTVVAISVRAWWSFELGREIELVRHHRELQSLLELDGHLNFWSTSELVRWNKLQSLLELDGHLNCARRARKERDDKLQSLLELDGHLNTGNIMLRSVWRKIVAISVRAWWSFELDAHTIGI